MVRIQVSKSKRIFLALMMMWAIILAPFSTVLAADAKEAASSASHNKEPQHSNRSSWVIASSH